MLVFLFCSVEVCNIVYLFSAHTVHISVHYPDSDLRGNQTFSLSVVFFPYTNIFLVPEGEEKAEEKQGCVFFM